MPTVIVTRPVIHDGEKKVPGDPIDNLTKKEAERLVRLGAARLPVNETSAPPTPPANNTGKTGDTESAEAAAARVMAIRTKKPLIAELASLGVESTEDEKVADLQAKLIAALSAGPDSVPGGGIPAEMTPEDEAGLAAMDKAALLDALREEGVEVDGSAGEAELRAKLKKQWYG